MVRTNDRNNNRTCRKRIRRNIEMIPTDKIAKFLILATNKNEIMFELGKNNIYVEALKFLRASKMPSTEHGLYFVKTTSDDADNFYKFIETTDLKSIRLFKSVTIKNKALPRGFLYSTAKNMCGLLQGKTIKVASKSKGIKTVFYDAMVNVNEKYKFKCKFDYSKFDIKASIKLIRIDNKHMMFVTYINGKGYHNSNHSGDIIEGYCTGP
jgi:hypothetical protein